MRSVVLAAGVVVLAAVLVLLLRRPAPAPAPPPRVTAAPVYEPELAPPSAAPVRRADTPHAPLPIGASPVAGSLLRGSAEPSPAAADATPDAAINEWKARAPERDYAYWDMKLGMLRKIRECVGDKLQTQGAAEVNYHFKKGDGVWIADHADVRDPNDEERNKMGAVDFHGADRDLAQKCISQAFEGVTMPITGGTDPLETYEVRGQIMFPTAADRAWKETGVSPN